MSLEIGGGRLYDPCEQELKDLYPQIAEKYATAFAEDPDWKERSKCPAMGPVACAGGLSAVRVGEDCGTCGLRPTEAAYPPEPLTEGFKRRAEVNYAAWYVETFGGQVAMAALAWRGKVRQIVAEKYGDVPEMAEWLTTTLGGEDESIIWLDEVFSDKNVRESGNLDNFVQMCRQFDQTLGMVFKDGGLTTLGRIAYRTKKAAMLKVAERFPGAKIFKASEGEVPDRRDFVLIDVKKGI